MYFYQVNQFFSCRDIDHVKHKCFNKPMRGKFSQIKSDVGQYSVNISLDEFASKKRLDLNDLLERAKNQKKNDRKHNFLIFFYAIFCIALVYLLVRLYL